MRIRVLCSLQKRFFLCNKKHLIITKKFFFFFIKKNTNIVIFKNFHLLKINKNKIERKSGNF